MKTYTKGTTTITVEYSHKDHNGIIQDKPYTVNIYNIGNTFPNQTLRFKSQAGVTKELNCWGV